MCDYDQGLAQGVTQAEKKLMEDMPIIPLVFYRDYYMASKELSGIKDTYYNFKILTKMKLKNYHDYLPAEETEKATEAE